VVVVWYCGRPSVRFHDLGAEHHSSRFEIGAGNAAGFAQELPTTSPDSDAEHGRGLVVMRALMDRVGFRLLPEAGSVVSLEKRLTYASTERSDGGLKR
jgi:hypothetical protein